MATSISKICGVTPFAATRLRKAGIRTTDDLLTAAPSARGRKALAAQTGIGEQQLLEWVNLVDCMRVPGMGKATADLLRAAGVTTLRELTHRHPGRLAQSMKNVNDARKLLRVLPSETSIGKLIEKARKLPLKITY